MESTQGELKTELDEIVGKIKEELRSIRSGRPSVELVEDLKVAYAGDTLSIKQLGTLSIVPPREIRVSVWDKNAVGPVIKAIEDAKRGLTVSNDGNIIRAILSPLSGERREELTKVVKKHIEEARIRVRGARDEAIKKLKALHDKKEITEDDLFKGKEKVQEAIDGTNENIEKILEDKMTELQE